MIELTGVAPTPVSYLQRDRQRTAEFHRLVAELERLRGDRRNNLGQIRSIGLRLQALADEQRMDLPPESDERLHGSLWRKIDIQARRADLILMSDFPPLDALDADYVEVAARSPDVTRYDIALMRLTGEPLPSRAPEAVVQEPISLQAWVGRIAGLAALASPVVLLSFAGHPLTGVLIVISAISVSASLRDWLKDIFGEPDTIAPNARADQIVADPVLYDDILERSIGKLNANIDRTTSPEATVADRDRSIIELQTLLQTIQRVRAPAPATQVQADLQALVTGWLGVFQAAVVGAPYGQALREIEELVARANAEIGRFRAAKY
jgi:hypothetical protein